MLQPVQALCVVLVNCFLLSVCDKKRGRDATGKKRRIPKRSRFKFPNCHKDALFHHKTHPSAQQRQASNIPRPHVFAVALFVRPPRARITTTTNRCFSSSCRHVFSPRPACASTRITKERQQHHHHHQLGSPRSCVPVLKCCPARRAWPGGVPCYSWVMLATVRAAWGAVMV